MIRAFELEDTSDVLNFEDSDKISPWAQDAVSKIVGAGIMNGITQITFAPQEKTTRAQAATVILRMLEKSGKL